MFKKSSTNKQLGLFDSPSGLMCDRESREYDNPSSWHNKFFREVTCNIDEDVFRPLFAEEREDKKDGRPTASIRILIAMSISVLFLSSVGVVSGICVIVAYLLMEIAYCLKLKRYAIIDVCMLSLGFVLRIIAGGVVTDIVISHWLVMMTFLLTLFLGIAKRRDDVLKMMSTGIAPRHNTKRYNLTFVNNAITITASVMLVCYIMYTVSPEVTENFHTRYLYLTSIFVLIGLLRYMQLAVVDEKTGDPTKILLHDRFTQLVVAAWGLTFLLIIYVV